MNEIIINHLGSDTFIHNRCYFFSCCQASDCPFHRHPCVCFCSSFSILPLWNWIGITMKHAGMHCLLKLHIMSCIWMHYIRVVLQDLIFLSSVILHVPRTFMWVHVHIFYIVVNHNLLLNWTHNALMQEVLVESVWLRITLFPFEHFPNLTIRILPVEADITFQDTVER